MAEGGQKLKVTTVFNRIPLYVRAGSIVPLGPDVQYVTEKKWDNLKVCVYPGADGNFVLYEDEGLSGNFWLLSFKISYLCLPLFYETRTTPSCHPSGCAYRQL